MDRAALFVVFAFHLFFCRSSRNKARQVALHSKKMSKLFKKHNPMYFLNRIKVRAIVSIFKIPAMTFMLVFTQYACFGQEGELPATSGAFYAISVRNIDEAVAWYTKQLGFKVESQGGNDQRKGALLSRPGTVLELGEFVDAIPRERMRPGLESHEVYGIFKIGFITTDLDQTFQILKSTGVEVFFPIVNASDGNRTFGIKDLEGNIIQFFGK